MQNSSLERIKKYLVEMALYDSFLKEKLEDTSVKSYEKMMAYINEEARKLCEKGSSSVCVDDDTVYKWARHYWLDYEEKVETTKETSLFEEKQPKTKKQDYEQMSLFDF